MRTNTSPPVDLSALIPTYVQTLERMSELIDELDTEPLAHCMRTRLRNELDTCSIHRAFANELMLWMLTRSPLTRTVAISLEHHDDETAMMLRDELARLVEQNGAAWVLSALKLISESEHT